MIAAILFSVLAVIFAVITVEKKRVNGALTYPLWTGSLLGFWLIFTLLFAVPVGSLTLPRFIGIALHPATAQGAVTEVTIDGHCHVTYRFAAGGSDHTGNDGLCGIKAGDSHAVYYDTSDPDNSSLYAPDAGLKNTLVATLLVSLGLAAAMVLWFRGVHILGKREL